jgi:integrase
MKRERGTGSLKVRKGVFWLRYRHAGTRVEESSGIRDDGTPAARNRALAALRAKCKRADTPQFIAPSATRVRFEDLADLLRRDYARRGNRTAYRLGTAAHPRGPLIHLSDWFGGWRALAITTDKVNQYADDRIEDDAQPATVNRELAALRRMFTLAVQQGMLPSKPHIAMCPEDNARQGFVEIGDLDTLLAALRARNPVAADVTEAAFLTCLRRGNLRGLTWDRFAFDFDQAQHVIGGELRLPGSAMKNRKPLVLPLTGRLLALVARRYAERQGPHIFQRHGAPIGQFRATWIAATEAVGRPGLLFHDLRRSGARALRRAGVDELTIMALGGWRTRTMFARYSITDSTDLAEAQAKLTAAFTTAPRTILPLRRTSGDSLGTPTGPAAPPHKQ